MKITDADIEKARTVSIHTLLGLSTNRRVSVRCVFHEDNSPSLCIYPGEGGYHCFGCGANGKNAIDFVMALGHKFPDAVQELLKL